MDIEGFKLNYQSIIRHKLAYFRKRKLKNLDFNIIFNN